jgi:hypothetical protein
MNTLQEMHDGYLSQLHKLLEGMDDGWLKVSTNVKGVSFQLDLKHSFVKPHGPKLVLLSIRLGLLMDDRWLKVITNVRWVCPFNHT